MNYTHRSRRMFAWLSIPLICQTLQSCIGDVISVDGSSPFISQSLSWVIDHINTYQHNILYLTILIVQCITMCQLLYKFEKIALKFYFNCITYVVFENLQFLRKQSILKTKQDKRIPGSLRYILLNDIFKVII